MALRFLGKIGTFSVSLWLCACSIHRAEEAPLPALPLPERFQEVGTESPTAPALDQTQWWQSFNDPTLTQLIETGMSENFSLQSAAARIKQAEAITKQSKASLFPMLNASAGTEFEWDGVSQAPSNTDREENRNAGAVLSWEADFLGRLSSIQKARAYESRATRQDLREAQLFLSAAIAERYFAILEQSRQLDVLQTQIEINESLLKLTTLRYGQGQASIVDVLQQREQLDETKARFPEAESELGTSLYALDALLGKVPGSSNLNLDTPINKLAPLPETGVPASLLSQRPDLRASSLRLTAIDFRVAEAVAAQYPRIQLGGSIRWNGDPDFGDAIKSAFADLTVPLFAAGNRRTEVAIRKAQLEEALADHSSLLLDALVEVESSLLSERKLRKRLELVEAQLQSSRRLLKEARNRYSQGLTDYLPVFTSLNIVQNLEREIVSARRDVLSARIAVHRALGGPLSTLEKPAR